MTIPALPDAPALSDSPEQFNAKAFAFVAALDDWGTAANAVGADADADAASAAASASTATTQAGIATAAAGTATTQAGIATTKAGEAATSANLADASADAANLSAIAADASADAAAASAASIDPASLLTKAGNLSGLASPATARDNLGVEIGVDVQAFNAALAAIAANNGTNAMKNRIINGAMMIDQRNAGASVSGTGVFAVDRFGTDCVNAVLQSQQSSDIPSGQGFAKSLKVTVTTASSNASNDFAAVNQKIEANNVSDFMLGTSYAATMTLSFWVKASVTGTYVVSFQNGEASRESYPATYTISSANTWEKKTITLVGDTSGTWGTGNGNGIWVRFDLGSGSNFLGTANTWQNANVMRVSGAAKLSDTLNATFYITGVQLEKGSTATSFDYRPYGTELALCQRYCVVLSGTGDYGWGTAQSSSGGLIGVTLPVAPRVPPTGITATVGSAPDTLYVYNGAGSSSPITGLTFSTAGYNTARLVFSGASGLTAGQATPLYSNGSTPKVIFNGMEL